MEETKHVKTMADLANQWEESQRRWFETRRVGGVAYDVENDVISIDVEGGLDTYDIAFDRIQTPRQFTEWMFHLNEKKWMTGQLYKDFLDCLTWVIREKTGQLFPIQFYKVVGSS